MSNVNLPNNSLNEANETKKGSSWTNLEIYSNMILHVSNNTVLIAMPFKSEYAGYCFNHPKRLARETKNKNLVQLSFSESFKFNIFKREKNEAGQYVTVDEKELSYDEMKKILEPVDADIKAYRQKKKESKKTSEEKQNDVI